MIIAGKVRINILPARVPTVYTPTVRICVLPAVTEPQKLDLTYPVQFTTRAPVYDLTTGIIESANDFIRAALDIYIDEQRELKTLLNFGDDKQTPILAQRYGGLDDFGVNTIQVKLIRPIPDDIEENTRVFLSREVAQSLIDKVRIRFAPPIDTTPYLRPRNTAIKINDQLGKQLNNVTLKSLNIQTGSVGSPDAPGNYSFEDRIYRQWYSYDFNSTELNIDFTNYANFVFYGSAALRLQAFRQKLMQLEQLEQQRLQFEGGIFTGSYASLGATAIMNRSADIAVQKETLIRSFDRYEQYLYFTPSGSVSPYSASFDYVDGGIEYNPIGYWPKDTNGQLFGAMSVSGSAWFDTQIEIAQRFDEFNENNLINTIPTHVREHADDNGPYITFVAMIGHFFDLIKPYIDQFPYVYSRSLNPDEELSKDLVTNIAEAVGFQLPTLNSLTSLADSVLGDTGTPKRDFTVETHKRLLHNLPFFAKAKGTRTALISLLRSFGIAGPVIDVLEVGRTQNSESTVVFDEYTDGIDFDATTNNQWIRLPLSSSLRSPRTLQFNMTVALPQDMTVLTGDDKWALHIKRHPSNPALGRFELASGSTQTTILTSSYHELFFDELLNVAIQTDTATQATTLRITRVEGQEVLYSSTHSEPTSANIFVPLWDSTANIFVGGSGSLVQGRFDGTIDEVRLWGKTLSDETLLRNAFDPGNSAGDLYTDYRNFLYVQLSFTSGSTKDLPLYLFNESAYKDIDQFPAIRIIFTSNIVQSDISRYVRTVRQQFPEASNNGYTTSKVYIAPPPVFTTASTAANGVKQLSRTRSIVAVSSKPKSLGRNKVIISTSPSRPINQNILRVVGQQNIQAFWGIPELGQKAFPNQLKELQDYYTQFYFIRVDYNQYIRVLSSVSSIINEVINYFIPARATALNGILIEPTLLERNKIPMTKSIRFYGKNTRRTNKAMSGPPDYEASFNLDVIIPTALEETSGTFNTYTGFIDEELHTTTGTYANINWSATINDTATTLVANHLSYTGTVNTDTATIAADSRYYTSSIPYLEQDIAATYNTYEIQHEQLFTPFDNCISFGCVDNSDQTRIELAYSTGSKLRRLARVDTNISKLNKIPYDTLGTLRDGSEPYARVYPRKLFDYEVELTKLRGDVFSPDTVHEIKPYVNFDDITTTTYFSSPSGIYYFPSIERIPVPTYDITATWDSDAQTFIGATTWTPGTRYNYGQVVYQDIDKYTPSDVLEDNVILSAQPGNKKWYVFIDRAELSGTTIDGSAAFVGGVPSTIPPSLDRSMWQRIRFRPQIRQAPRRIVFDTFTIPDPQLNNFKVTTIDPEIDIDVPDRYVDYFSIPSVPASSQITGEFLMQNMLALFALQASTANIRIRLYPSSTLRNTDLSRDRSTFPSATAGVLLDMELGAANTITYVNPIALLTSETGINADGVIYYTIDNLTTSDISPSFLTAFYFALEVEPRVPQGYLPRHYRFFRDNATATKRRNFLGCKNTIDTTIDGQSPVQVFIGEGVDIVVAPTQTNEEIITGGGGILDVS
jgi:hypothetical protein